jgi:hypothetical protein
VGAGPRVEDRAVGPRAEHPMKPISVRWSLDITADSGPEAPSSVRGIPPHGATCPADRPRGSASGRTSWRFRCPQARYPISLPSWTGTARALLAAIRNAAPEPGRQEKGETPCPARSPESRSAACWPY